MSRFIPLLAIIIVAYALVVAPAHAVSSDQCGDRIVNKPRATAADGCRVWGCRLSLKIAHDKKGVYCIRQPTGCHVRCNKPKT